MPEIPRAIGLPSIESDASSAIAGQLDPNILLRQDRTEQFLKFSVPSVMAGMADTFGTSLGLLEEGELTESLKGSFAQFGDYYERNAQAARTVGDLTGMFIPGLAATKAFRAGSILQKQVGGKSKLLGSVFSSGQSYDRLLRGVRARDLYLAKQGSLNFLDDAARQGMVNRALSTRLADTVKETIAFEAGVFATMNTSDVLYPDEFTVAEIIALNAVFPAGLAVAEGMYLKRLIRASAARPELAEIAKRVRNTEDVPLDEVVSRPGDRDLKLTILGIAKTASDKASQEASDTIKASALNANALTMRAEIANEVQKLGKDSLIEGFTKSTNFGEKSGEVRNLVGSIDKDPTVLLGTRSAERLPEFPYDELAAKKKPIDTRKRKINKIKAEAKKDRNGFLNSEEIEKVTALQKQIDEIESNQALILEVDGSLSLASNRKAMFQDAPTKTKKIRPGADTDFTTFSTKTKPPRGRSREVAFTGDGILRLPSIQGDDIVDRFDQLDFFHTTAVYGVIQDAVQGYKTGTGKQIILSTDDHFTRFDYVRALHNKHGDNILGDIQLPAGIENIEQLEFASLKKKYQTFTKRREQIERLANNKLIPDSAKLEHSHLARMLNLPATTTLEPHPLFMVFEDLFRQGDESFEDAKLFTMEQLKRLTQEHAFFPELTQFLNAEIDFTGNMLRLERDHTPVLLHKRPIDIRQYNRDLLVNQTAMQRANVLSDFAQAEEAGAGLVARVFNFAQTHPELTKQTQDTGRLVEGTQKGSGLIGTQQRARGEVATVQSAQAWNELAIKEFRNAPGGTAEIMGRHTATMTQLRARANEADLVSHSLYVNARRQGWDIKPEPIIDEAGNAQFALTNSATNKERFEILFGRELVDGDMMPAPTRLQQGKREYKPLVTTPLAFQAAQAWQDWGTTVLQNTNHLKKIYGRGATKLKPWWVPPKNLSRDETVFVVDPHTERTINVVSAKNKQEAIRIAQREIKERDQKGLIYVTQDDMAKYFSLQDDAFERFTDFSDPLNQTGPSKGRAVNIATVEEGPKVLNEMVDTIESKLESVFRRSTAAYFEPQITHAKRLLNANAPASAKKGQSVWQQYTAALFGNPTLNPNDIVGAIYFPAEKVLDDVLETVWQKTLRANEGTIRPPTSTEQRRFEKLKSQLGEHTPFEDAQDYAERVLRIQTPPRLKPIFAGLNKLTSLLTLRLFEVGHSVLTLTSLGATMPGVVKALKRAPHENDVDYAARIGAFGLKVDGDNAMFHPTRAITSGIHFMFTKEGRELWEKAASKGYMDQNVAEIFKTLTAPKEGYAGNLFRRATDMASVLSDKSERLARGISFATGYNIAKRGLGIQREEAAFAFAHRFANETIGNYAPNNRPRIFQGAAGMPLGLFMTFMWNYYERLFSYIGNKQGRALAVQYATQAAVFGGQTVPGFQQFSDFFASNYDGTTNIVDGLERTFGTETAEWFLHGTISNLPKLVGADDGIALSTRGDTGFRNIPTLFTFQDTPVYAMMRDGVNALRRGFEQVRERGGLSVQQSAEIMQNYSTSRFFRNLGYLTTGFVTDRRGQVVGRRDELTDILQGDIENSLGLVASIAGLRTIDENRRVRNAYAIRSGEISRASRMRQLRDRTRADIRAGITDTDLNEIVESYVKYGGSPEGIPRWLTEQHLASTVNKDLTKLKDIITNPRRGADIRRLITTIGPGHDGDPDY